MVYNGKSWQIRVNECRIRLTVVDNDYTLMAIDSPVITGVFCGIIHSRNGVNYRVKSQKYLKHFITGKGPKIVNI